MAEYCSSDITFHPDDSSRCATHLSSTFKSGPNWKRPVVLTAGRQAVLLYSSEVSRLRNSTYDFTKHSP